MIVVEALENRQLWSERRPDIYPIAVYIRVDDQRVISIEKLYRSFWRRGNVIRHNSLQRKNEQQKLLKL